VERYTLEKCSLEAKVIHERANNARMTAKDTATCSRAASNGHENALGVRVDVLEDNNSVKTASVDENDDEYDDDQVAFSVGGDNRARNRFSDLA
jgi:hypothetical protein